MAKITYNLYPFNAAKASQGSLVVMVVKTWNIEEHPTITNEPMVGVEIQPFGGAGICRFSAPNTYIFTVNSTTFSFNDKGNSNQLSSQNYKLLLGEIQQTISDGGGLVTSDTSRGITRAADGSYSEVVTDEESQMIIDTLNARDQFAIQCLKQLMSIDKNRMDPTTVSDNEMAHYCELAYRWAANMMNAAAKTRATMTDETGSSVDEESLASNTEKLLYDIKDALQRTDLKEGDDYYERISLKGWDDLMAKLTDIKNAIVAQTSAITTVATAINNLELSPTINNNIIVPEQAEGE